MSTSIIRRKLTKSLMIFYLSYKSDYDSFDIDYSLKSNKNDLLKSFQLFLSILVSFERTRRNKTQLILLIRTLLKFFDDKVNLY